MGLPTLGLSILSNCNSSDCATYAQSKSPDPRNPDPSNFKLLRYGVIGSFVIVEILYPNCTNYEGRKICLYKASLDEVYGADELDPHFCEGKHLSPIARFEPTPSGWSMAEDLVKLLESQNDK